MTFKEQVIQKIKEIPSGKVATYGQIAALAGSPRAALMVGRILRHSSESEQLPWQRVINSKGRISIVNMEYPAELQAELLREEGVRVEMRAGPARNACMPACQEQRGSQGASMAGGSYYIDLAQFLWQI